MKYHLSKSYLSINLGWGLGTALGVWVSGGISGGHINPAVSFFFSFCLFELIHSSFRLLWRLLFSEGFLGKKYP